MIEGIDDWNNTSILLSDERLCDKNMDSSNYFQFNKYFIDQISNDLVKPKVLYIPDNFYLSKGSQKKQSIFSSMIKDYRYSKLCLLGLGSDSHTASLFPNNNNNINLNDKNCFFIKREDESYHRLTLTYSYLMDAEEIFFLAIGKNKSESIYNCIHSIYDPLKYPAQYIFKNYSNKISLFADSNALSLL